MGVYHNYKGSDINALSKLALFISYNLITLKNSLKVPFQKNLHGNLRRYVYKYKKMNENEIRKITFVLHCNTPIKVVFN